MPKAASERATTQCAVASERLASLSDARYPIYDRQVLPTSPQGGVGIRLEDTGVGGGLKHAGAALRQVSVALGDIAELQQRRQQADNAINLTEADTGASRELSDLDAQLGDEAIKPVNPVHRNPTKRVEARRAEEAGKIRDCWLATIPDEDVLARFDHSFQQRSLSGGLELRRVVGLQRAGTAVATMNAALEVQVRAAASAPNEVARNAAKQPLVNAVDAAWQAGAISDVDRGKILRTAKHNIDETAVLRDGQIDPAATLARLADAKNYPDLAPDRRPELMHTLDAWAYSRKVRGEQETRTKRTDIKEQARSALAVLNDGVAYAGLDDLIRQADGAGLPEVATTLRDGREDVGYYKDLKTLPPDAIRAAAERDRKARRRRARSDAGGALRPSRRGRGTDGGGCGKDARRRAARRGAGRHSGDCRRCRRLSD